jgi:hypothetical protein
MKIRRKIRQSLPIKRTFDAHGIGLPRQGPNFSRKSAGQITMAPSFSEVTLFFGATVLGKISCTSVHTKIDQIAG